MIDGSDLPEDRKPLRFDGPIIPFKSGLYASERLLDALPYARSHTICRVTLERVEFVHPDKVCARERTIEWRIDGGTVLRAFARFCGWQALPLTDFAAVPVFETYLRTGRGVDEVRERSRIPVGECPWTSSNDASWWSANDALFAASWEGALDSAGYPPQIAARDAAWMAAWALARAHGMSLRREHPEMSTEQANRAADAEWNRIRAEQERVLVLLATQYREQSQHSPHNAVEIAVPGHGAFTVAQAGGSWV